MSLLKRIVKLPPWVPTSVASLHSCKDIRIHISHGFLKCVRTFVYSKETVQVVTAPAYFHQLISSYEYASLNESSIPYVLDINKRVHSNWPFYKTANYEKLNRFFTVKSLNLSYYNSIFVLKIRKKWPSCWYSICPVIDTSSVHVSPRQKMSLPIIGSDTH